MSDSQSNETLLTIAEAAEFLNVSKVTVRRWTNEGRLPCLRVGPRKERRFIKAELQKLLSGSEAVTGKSEGLSGRHQCLVCNDSAHELEAIADAVARHVAGGSQIVLLSSNEKKAALQQLLLASRGMDASSLISSGAIKHLTIESSYLLSGSFTAAKAIAFVESQILEAVAHGADTQLIVGDTDWIFLGSSKDDQSLIAEVWDYEEQLNSLVAKYPGVEVLCPYALDKITAEVVVRTFMVHPKLRVEGEVIDGLTAPDRNPPQSKAG